MDGLGWSIIVKNIIIRYHIEKSVWFMVNCDASKMFFFFFISSE